MTGLRLLVAAVVGVAAGLVSVFHHAHGWGWLALALALPLALTVAAPGRAARVGFTLGWSGLVLAAVLGTDEGDVLVVADPKGWILLGAALLLVVVAFATIPVRRGPGS